MCMSMCVHLNMGIYVDMHMYATPVKVRGLLWMSSILYLFDERFKFKFTN